MQTFKPTKFEVEALKLLQRRLGITMAQLNFDQGIPTVFLTIQIELSRILDKVHGVGAGILTLHDIININKKTYPEEVRSFFQVMEVYGFGTEIEFRASST